MIKGFVSSAVIFAMLTIATPASGDDMIDALRSEAALCKAGMPKVVGQTGHLDTFTESAYRVLTKARRFAIQHEGESRPGSLFVALDIRHRIIALYTKYYTWGELAIKRHPLIITDISDLDLSHIATKSGIAIGSPETAVQKLPGPKTVWLCSGQRQILFVNSCDSTQFSIVNGRVAGIKSSYGGC